MSEDAFLDLTGVTLVSEDTDEDDEGDVFNILSFKKAIYEVHAHRVWAQMVQWRFLPIFLLIYSVVPLCNCILPSDKTSNLGISLQSFYTFSRLQKFFCKRI